MTRELESKLSTWKSWNDLLQEGVDIKRSELVELVKKGKLIIEYRFYNGNRVERYIKDGVRR